MNLTNALLAAVGITGALIDVALHYLQMVGVRSVSARATAILTLLSCVLVGVSLTVAFNWGAALVEAFVGGLAVYAIAANKEMP